MVIFSNILVLTNIIKSNLGLINDNDTPDRYDDKIYYTSLVFILKL